MPDPSGQDLVIHGARVIDPASNLDRTADIAVSHGRIAAIGPGLPRTGAPDSIDGSGLIACPGLIDPHVHLREPGGEHKETLRTGGEAALAGGFTTVCCMPNTRPALDSPELIRFIVDRAAATTHCRIFPIGAISIGRQGERLTEIPLLARAGAVGFSDDGDGVDSPAIMARALAAVRQTGLALMQHCQERTLTAGACMHAGAISIRFGLTGWPRVAEELMIERDIRLNRAIGCRYHVQHLSSGGSVDVVRRARAEGLPVTAEVSPHHLLLTHEAVAEPGPALNTNAKMNPPLREAGDLAAIREGIADGTITVLATDHAPHSTEEKALPFESAPFGIIGLETALALYAQALVEPGHCTWPHLIRMMTVEPASLCNLDGLGRLSIGGPADITLIDPDAPWIIGPADLRGRSTNTPFIGRAVRARPVATIVGGTVRYRHPTLVEAGT